MDIFLQPKKDNQMMREFGPWTAVKLDYLARYIDIFETSMHAKPWRRRNYIDLFAGPGKCVIPENNFKLRSCYLTRYDLDCFLASGAFDGVSLKSGGEGQRIVAGALE